MLTLACICSQDNYIIDHSVTSFVIIFSCINPPKIHSIVGNSMSIMLHCTYIKTTKTHHNLLADLLLQA